MIKKMEKNIPKEKRNPPRRNRTSGKSDNKTEPKSVPRDHSERMVVKKR